MMPTGRILYCAMALVLLGQHLLKAQTPTAETFEVASIKVSNDGSNGVSGGCHGVDSLNATGRTNAAPPLGRCVIRAARLSHLIGIAFPGTPMANIRSGPDWIARGDERFDVDAKAENPSKATEGQLLEMLQALLKERFELKYHFQPVEVSGLALKVGKNGPKLQATRGTELLLESNLKTKEKASDPHILRLRKCTMTRFAELLTFASRSGPVVDQTGLTGEYDLSLTWDDDAGPTMSTALGEQLRLRLEPQKVTQSIFVIESAKRPGAN